MKKNYRKEGRNLISISEYQKLNKKNSQKVNGLCKCKYILSKIKGRILFNLFFYTIINSVCSKNFLIIKKKSKTKETIKKWCFRTV